MSVAPDECKWAPIGKKDVTNLAGSFDGNNHTISNIDGMLFGTANGWIISNIGIVGGNFYPNTEYADATGSLIGVSNYAYVYSCYSTATGQGIDTVGGGLVGKMSGFVFDCYFAGSIYGDRTMPIGGIVGSSYGGNIYLEISNCHTYSENNTIDSKNGELVGLLHQGSTIENCYYADYTGSGRKSIGTSESSVYIVDSVSTASAYSYQDFHSGKITHLLSNGVTDGTQVWYQNIDNGLTPNNYPVLESNGQNTVYKVDLEEKTYSNYLNGEPDLSLLKQSDLRTYQRIVQQDGTLSEKSQIAMGYGEVDNKNKVITVYMADIAERMGILMHQGVDGKKGVFKLQGNYPKYSKTSAELLMDPSFVEPDIYTDGSGCIFISQPKAGSKIPEFTVQYTAKPLEENEPIIYTLKVEIIDTSIFTSGSIIGGTLLDTLDKNDPDYNVIHTDNANSKNEDNKQEDSDKQEDNKTSTLGEPPKNTQTSSGVVQTGAAASVEIFLSALLAGLVALFVYRRKFNN